MAGRAFFVLQTGSIFSQKAGEHHGNRLYLRREPKRWNERKKRAIGAGAGREGGTVDFSSSHREFQARTEHSVSNPINPLAITNNFLLEERQFFPSKIDC